MKKLGIIITVSVVCILIFIALLVLFLVPYVKRTHDDIGALPPIDFNNDTNYKLETCPAHLVFSAASIHKSMFYLITRAQSEIVLCTYRWRVEHNSQDCLPPGAILAIGYALASLSKQIKKTGKTICFHILTNQFLYQETNQFVQKNIEATYWIWKKLGFEASSPGITVEFRAWQHCSLGNCHDKFLVVDQRYSLVHSSNIEAYSHGRVGSWIESGVLFDNPILGAKLYDIFQSNFQKCRFFDFKPTIFEEQNEFICSFGLSQADDYVQSAPELMTTNMLISHNSPRPFALNRNNPIMHLLVPLLQHAQKEVNILSPNFNDICILNALLDNPRITINVILAKGFNVESKFGSQFFLGYSTNEALVRAMKNKKINFRWHATESGEPVIGKTSFSLHSKTFIIDDTYLILGSFNADIFSSISSSETISLLQSSDCAMSAKNNFFLPLWEQAIPTS